MHIFPLALGAEVGQGNLSVGVGTPTGAVVPVADGSSANGVDQMSNVTITTLENILPRLELEYIDLLKIDVEGAEVDVLRGAGQVLSHVERIVVEYHSRPLLDQVIALLQSHDIHSVLDIPATFGGSAGILYAMRPSH